jgi:hypothetical protein
MMPMSNGFFDFVGSSIAISLRLLLMTPQVYLRLPVNGPMLPRLSAADKISFPRGHPVASLGRTAGGEAIEFRSRPPENPFPEIITLTESCGNS